VLLSGMAKEKHTPLHPLSPSHEQPHRGDCSHPDKVVLEAAGTKRPLSSERMWGERGELRRVCI
jgi:hypothetical protein